MNFANPVDYQAEFEDHVWETFRALGIGYSAFLSHPVNGPTIQLIPPVGSEYAKFHHDEEVIQELVEKGLVDKKNDNLTSDSTARYELTEKGHGVYAQVRGLTFSEGERVFTKMVQPKLK